MSDLLDNNCTGCERELSMTMDEKRTEGGEHTAKARFLSIVSYQP